MAELFNAIKQGNILKVQDMLARFHGINLEEKDPLGNSMLNIAAQCDNAELCELLLQKGAYVNTQNNKLNSPLHYAKALNFRRVFEILLTYKAD